MSSKYCRLCGTLAWPDGTEAPDPKDARIKELEGKLQYEEEAHREATRLFHARIDAQDRTRSDPAYFAQVDALRIANLRIEELEGKVKDAQRHALVSFDHAEDLEESLRELCDVVEGHVEDGDVLDSFTTQPARTALRSSGNKGLRIEGVRIEDGIPPDVDWEKIVESAERDAEPKTLDEKLRDGDRIMVQDLADAARADESPDPTPSGKEGGE